jgi:hypothetical protein
MSRFSQSLFAACVITAFASLAHAAPFADGGFESPTVSPGTIANFPANQSLGPWSILGTAGNFVTLVQTTYSEPNNNITQFTAEEGLSSLDLTGPGNTGPANGISQTFTTLANGVYTISFFVGRASGNGNYATPSTVDLSLNGATPVPFTNTNSTPGTINWQQFSLFFVAPSTSTTIAFFNGTTDNNYAGLDNIAITFIPPVPEPASLTLLTLAAPLLLRRPRNTAWQCGGLLPHA